MSPTIVTEVMMDRAMDLALGLYGHASAALADVTDELGRDLTPAELIEWRELQAEGRVLAITGDLP